MVEDNWDNYEPVADVEGRLRDFPAGSFREDDEMTEKILRSAQVVRDQDFEPPKPYSSEDLVEQYNFFRENVHNPKRVF